jgi:hypothetical protein
MQAEQPVTIAIEACATTTDEARPPASRAKYPPSFCTVLGFGGGLEAAAQDMVIWAGEG